MKNEYSKMNLNDLLRQVKIDPKGVHQYALKSYLVSKKQNFDDKSIKSCMKKLYWVNYAIHKWIVGKNYSESKTLITHPSRRFEINLEPEVRLSQSSKFESIENYRARLSPIFNNGQIEPKGDYWKNKQNTVVDFLRTEEIDNFKRTYGHVLSNFFPRAVEESDLQPLINFMMDVSDFSVFTDDVEPVNFHHIKKVIERISTVRLLGPADILHNLYAHYTSLIWRKAIFHDDLFEMPSSQESLLGNPYRIRSRGELVSQDLARSSTEFNTIKSVLKEESSGTILEIGAGYGRLCEFFLQKGIKKYIIVDIFPSIYLAEQYLKSRFPKSNIFCIRDFCSFSDVEQEFHYSDIVLITPEQMALLNDRIVDITININSFMEMNPSEVSWYIRQIDRICTGFIYTKQWIENNQKPGIHVYNRNTYPFPRSWKKIIDRTDPLHPDFFEQIWAVR
ncbi:MAG: putative sugar O-methyltransferase [Flavobacteriaceae bacterium]|nr:putative sugar O-methyltransferase [Flavobacteriaceae bacterium]